MRKSFEGLGGIVESSFPGELLGGSMSVFINRRRTHVKIMSWGDDGLRPVVQAAGEGHVDKKSCAGIMSVIPRDAHDSIFFDYHQEF